MKQLARVLRSLADRDHCVFSSSDLAAVVPSGVGQRVLLSRAVDAGVLQRICRGIYLYPVRDYPAGRLLYHAAARLRASEFNYISLESALSDAGVISQMPIQWITLLSSGRSHVVNCGDYGQIEFIHTDQQPERLAGRLTFDPEARLWRASVPQALRDMRVTRRSMDLINPEMLHEFV